jgi:DNA-binding transcriptional LysR family regulator
MFDWNDLRHFLATARAGSTLGASRGLGVNQSTVARRLDALEAACGAKLFERDRNGASLTALGADLLPHAEAMEKAAESLEHRLNAHHRGMTGVVRLTCSELMATIGVIPAMGDFRRLYPEIRVELALADAFLDLEKGEADVAIRASFALPSSNLIARKIREESWALYCSHAYAQAHGAPTRESDLSRHAIIGSEGAMENLPPTAWLREKAGPDAAPAIRCSTLHNVLSAVLADLGVAALPNALGGRYPELRYCLPIPHNGGVWVMTTAELRNTPRIRAFIDFIAPHLAAMARPAPASAPTP